MLRALRNSMRFYSLQLFAYEMLVLFVNAVAWFVSYPFRKTWSIFDMAAVWLWAYHWNKPIWSWGFIGYWIGALILSVIMESISERLWSGE